MEIEKADQGKPNILMIWGDDIAKYNISAYDQSSLGYRTSNIERLAKEGTLFTYRYGQQSCTSAQAAVIAG